MKPTITKEQAEELETHRRSGYSDEQILTDACYNRLRGKLGRLSIKELSLVLWNGYEVEKTPEDKVRDYFKDAKTRCRERRDAGDIEGKRYNSGKVAGVINTLNFLGYKIEGVNT